MKNLLIILFVSVASSVIGQVTKEKEVKAWLRSEGYTIATEQYANITKGNTAYYWKSFSAGTEYKVIGWSEDNDVTDIDLYIYEEDDELYASDTKVDALPEIEFELLFSRDLKVVIKNTTSSTPNYESKISFIIAYK